MTVLPAIAEAQDSEKSEEIIVTARRRAEDIQKVPAGITAFGAAQLAQRQIQTDEDLQVSVPGLTIRTVEGSNQIFYSLRGQTVDGFSGTATAVVPYVNDVQFNSAGAASFFDLESVQVLKGPQGTLFGRNATGGAILFNTTAPRDEFGGYMEARVGNYGYVEGTGALNIPIVKDKVAFRVAFDIADRRGYQENLYDGKKLGEMENRYGRGSLALTPNDRLKNVTVFQYGHSGGSSAVPVGYSIYSRDANGVAPKAPDGSTLVTSAADFYSPATFNFLFGAGGWDRFLAGNPGILASQPNAQTLGLAGFLASRETQPFWSAASVVDGAHNQTNYFTTNTTTYELSDNVTLKNIIGYFYDRSVDVAGETGVPYGIQYTANLATGDYGNYYGTKGFSEEFQVQGKALNDALNYIVGAFYQHSSRHTYYPQYYFSALPLAPGLGVNNDNIGRTTNYAIFAQATYDLSSKLLDGLSVTGGVRYSWEESKLLQLQRDSAFSNLPEQKVKFNKPSWEAGLQYQVTPEILTYVKGRGSWRGGGLSDSGPHRNASFSAIPPGNVFQPETVTDVEAGLKYGGQVFNRPAHLNVDLYRTWINGTQRSEFPNYQGAQIAVTINLPKATVQGIEIDGTIKPTEWLTLGASGAVTEATFVTASVLVLGNVFTFGPWADVPKYSGTLYTQIELPMAPEWGSLTLRADLYAQSAQYFSNNNATILPGTRLPSYKLLNGKLDWHDIKGSNVSIGLFARNITNEKYYSGGLAQGAGFGVNAANVGRPRMFGAQIRYEF